MSKYEDNGEFNRCVSCDDQLGRCSLAAEELPPQSVSGNDETLRSYCACKLPKDD